MRKAQFLTELRVQLADDKSNAGRGVWMLEKELTYYSPMVGAITVPKGFLTDFASVPRVPIAYWLCGDTCHRGAVVHDYLYRKQVFRRGIADDLLFEASEVDGVPAWRRWAIHIALGLFGWVVWNRYRVERLGR